MSCINHTDKPGKFQCVNCRIVLCSQCVKSFQAGGFFTYFCPACNSQCEEIDEKQSPASAPPAEPAEKKVHEEKIPAPAPEKPLPPEKKIPVPPEEIKIKIEKPEATTPAVEEMSSPDEPPPVPEASATPPSGRKIIRLETDDVDEMSLKTTSASAVSSQRPSVPEKPAVTADNKIPSFPGYFLTLFFKPGKTFKTMAIQMEKSMPLKLQSLMGFLIFLSLLVFIRFQNHPFTFSMLSSLTDTLLFLFFFTFFSVSSQEIKSKVNLGMCGLTLFSFLQSLHITVIYALSFMALTDYALYSGLAFILIKGWIFYKGFQSFNDKGSFQNLLYCLVLLFSQWLAESAFFQWFYI